MNVKDAVGVAKRYVADLFVDENIQDLGLEEVEFDTSDQTWKVTIGFSRPWNNRNSLVAFTSSGPRRDYKIVRISDVNSEVLSVKQHSMTDNK